MYMIITGDLFNRPSHTLVVSLVQRSRIMIYLVLYAGMFVLACLHSHLLRKQQ
jgi:hypothetical protein